MTAKKKKKTLSLSEKSNREILRFAYVIVFLFLCMIGYEGFFLSQKRDEIINNTYNSRLDSFADRVIRGDILSSDGQILAQTQQQEDGTELRSYPYGDLFAHVVGYSSMGKTGLEAQGNFYMLSSHINLMEQVMREFSGQKNPGDDLYTTLDLELQKTASDALGDRRGAVVVMEPDTGRILAMVSKPAYDPNQVQNQWDSLRTDPESRLLNRATQGVYPPGSTFKIITLLEFMREYPEEYRDFHYDCSGVLEQGDYTIQCYHKTAHGSQNLEEAFANSCNGAFATIGMMLNQKKLFETTQELLYDQNLPVPLSYSKSVFTEAAQDDTWQILLTAIGQGKTQITPMHSAMITAAIANGGTLMKPYLMDHVVNAAGEMVKAFTPEAYGNLMTASEAEALGTMMRAVVTEGTGSKLKNDQYTVAGKTGSAEFETGKETHAWFTGYAPAENPQLAVSVIVEEGGSGGAAAAPIARAVFDNWFSRNK